MRINYSKHILYISLLAVLACGNNTGKQDNNTNIDTVTELIPDDDDAEGGNACLLGYQSKYDAMITEAEVLAATGFSRNVMETKYNKVLKNPENHEFLYKFKNNRMGKIPGFKNEMQVPDVIVVRAVKPMSIKTFNQLYKAVTEEQMQKANDALNDVGEGNSGNAEADKALKEAEKQGVDREQIKGTGKSLTGAFKEVSKGYRTVTGVGSAARWNIVTSELFVLQDGVKFEIRADVSNDTEKNKMVALQLAKDVLSKCN
ncbi:hypothetical protein [Flavobacterium sp. MK4S-17]|uniref:hypothetical protein n=1 Tax=Flavobacterium sp. MK4S-17 TaxID=2543737 RepID=UPI001358091D|nr:hypothetical protein [Flavobacterium sp. MK4S-17]